MKLLILLSLLKSIEIEIFHELWLSFLILLPNHTLRNIPNLIRLYCWLMKLSIFVLIGNTSNVWFMSFGQGVECQIFVILIFFNCSQFLQFEAHSRSYKDALTREISFLVICTTLIFMLTKKIKTNIQY